MIAVDQRTDPGYALMGSFFNYSLFSSSPSVMTSEEFNETSIRCGRILKCSDEV